MNDAIRMQISAFVDGELPQNEAELLLRRMCQDGDLRQQAAEFLAAGRVMRGERSVAGMKHLRDRIAATLDDTSLVQEELVAGKTGGPRFLRPLAGVAIAATVALAAVIGLQQVSSVPGVDTLLRDAAVADIVDNDSYTVPEQDDGQLRDYYLRHTASSSYFGANSINARLVTLQLREDVNIDSGAAEPPADDDEDVAAESAGSSDAQTP